MKPYSHVLRTRGFNYPLTRVVLKTKRFSPTIRVLLLTTLIAPVITNADTEELAKAKNCFSCHKIDSRRIGPSYINVAKKYSRDKNAEAKIIKQIKEGSVQKLDEPDLPPQPIVATVSGFPTSGLWREVLMPPQPQVSKDEAKQLADWILSLNKKKLTTYSN